VGTTKDAIGGQAVAGNLMNATVRAGNGSVVLSDGINHKQNEVQKMKIKYIGAWSAILVFVLYVTWDEPANIKAYESQIESESWESYFHRDEQSETEEVFGDYLQYIVRHEINWDHMAAFIELDGSILTGTDIMCEEFARMMVYITQHDMLVYITNSGWIPSVYNPIDEYTAQILAGKTPYIPAK
jgi:hypothetical protein